MYTSAVAAVCLMMAAPPTAASAVDSKDTDLVELVACASVWFNDRFKELKFLLALPVDTFIITERSIAT